MAGRYEVMASGLTMDQVIAAEDRAAADLASRGLVVFECPGCRGAVRARQDDPVCPKCGRKAVLTEDGYAD